MGLNYKHVYRRFDGWKRDNRDHRDFLLSDVQDKFGLKEEHFKGLPASFALDAKMPAIWDQGSEGSCTAFSADALVVADLIRRGMPEVRLSEQFTYYNTRLLEHTQNSDSGAECRDVYKAYSKYGYCLDATYPYLGSTVTEIPTGAAYTEGRTHLVNPTIYARVPQNLDMLKAAIAAGYPVNCGMDVFAEIDSAQAAKTGILTMPNRRERPIGGHAIAYIGWDDKSQMIRWRNSWGSDWGDRGNGWLPYAMAMNSQITGDFWVFRTLT